MITGDSPIGSDSQHRLSDLVSANTAYGLAARLNVSLPGIEVEVAQHLLEATDQLCPYSNATRGNIDVTVKLV